MPTDDVSPFEDVALTPGGAEVSALFNKLQNTSGWWNADGDFTFEEFIGLWILHEASGDAERAIILTDTIAQNLYVGGYNLNYCTSDGCYNGVFNFIAAESQLGGGLFDGTENLSTYTGPIGNKWTMEDAGGYGYDSLHPNKLIWSSYYGPSNWGNSTPWRDGLREYKIPEGPGPVNGIDRTTVYYYWDTWIVFSLAQRGHWSSIGVDTSMDQIP